MAIAEKHDVETRLKEELEITKVLLARVKSILFSFALILKDVL